jgi:interleukin enhancer-binding factor 2
MSLVTKISEIADNLIVAPATFSGCQLEEAWIVGSYKKGTMIRGHNAADIVIILKTLPTKEAVEQLGTKVHADLTASGMTGVKFETNEHGFVITSDDATVNCLVTTISQNIRSLDRDLHLDVKVVQAHLAAVRHSRWFEENGRYSSVKILARLLKDLAMRYEGFSMLKPWMIDILSHYTTMGTRNNQPLPINQAFRRCLQLLSAGFFLPLSSSINDPCENAPVKIHSQLSLEEQDLLCMTAQNASPYPLPRGLQGDSRTGRRFSPLGTEDRQRREDSGSRTRVQKDFTNFHRRRPRRGHGE